MKKILLTCMALALAGPLSAQKFALKNNLLYDATLTPNLAVEMGLSPRMTLDVGAGYNWFKFSDDKQFKHWLVQPELRLWTCERFNGSFFGLHFHGGEFSTGGIKLPFGMYPDVKNYLNEGWLIGAGISFGHQWILANAGIWRPAWAQVMPIWITKSTSAARAELLSSRVPRTISE